MWRAIAFPYGEAATLTNQGLLFWEVGDYEEALARYLEAARIFEQLENAEGQAYVFQEGVVAGFEQGLRLETACSFRRPFVLVSTWRPALIESVIPGACRRFARIDISAECGMPLAFVLRNWSVGPSASNSEQVPGRRESDVDSPSGRGDFCRSTEDLQ